MIMVVIIDVGFHLFLISIGLLPDLHQTALSCCSFPIPNHPSPSSTTHSSHRC